MTGSSADNLSDNFLGNFSDNLFSGILPDADALSVTDCPVHALSTPTISRGEWIEMAWAARHAAHPGINRQRRGWFESVKCLLLERDLPPSRIFTQQLSSDERRT